MQSCPTSQVTCCMCMGQGYFIGFSALIEALKVVINSGLTCPICHLVVPQIESLHTHLVSHQNQVVLVPPEQNQVKDELDQILNDVNEIVCKDQFGSLINPSVSLQSSPTLPSEPVKSLQCQICGWAFDNQNFLDMHLVLMHSQKSNKDHNGQVKSFCCQICSSSCPSDTAYREHLRLAHNEEKFVCPSCGKLFQLRGSLLIHLRVVHNSPAEGGKQVFPCGFCNRKFGNQYRRNIHEKKHHSKNKMIETHPTTTGLDKIQCQQCAEEFESQSALLLHSVSHIQISNADNKSHQQRMKQWTCDVCHKSFTTKYFLKKHKRLHTGETPYTCSICGRSFTFQQSFHKHMLYHSDEKPYSCGQCGRAFKELSTLQNHERIHTGERPFSCETCGKSFRQRVSYLVHRRIHTGDTPYNCQACGKSFRYKVTQRTHKCLGQGQGQGQGQSNMVDEAHTLPLTLPPNLQLDLRKIRFAKKRRSTTAASSTITSASALTSEAHLPSDSV